MYSKFVNEKKRKILLILSQLLVTYLLYAIYEIDTLKKKKF